MKKLFKVALVAVSMLFVGNFAKAQTKIGYINFGALVTQMPEYKTIRSQVDIYQKQFIDQLTAMNTELQAKGGDYQKNQATMTDAARTAKQAELQDIQKRMQDYQNDAQQKVDAKTNELSKPLIDKARAAVADVAKEKGYTYVFDSSQGSPLIVSPEGDDLLAAVKLKLGLK
ncbi:periplasmic chaperone for outer membrane proteins Skp [Mucilaginibacter frigoritolerans]|jgi:outer membrane protein|uniref:Periplasmic chaperone for outer membrane proteins Skp n=1 Tax=Mucilaginibacter frigoritolerans TaxID=652788 RepID=A0A562U9M8_9SPHI|nr:OmpH family outer membrane protein [Mucilaginibacter frigoritolerans]TWJ02534.1 periplasmic chaperone for outer membrane proteins Skp [Mucilaginibacter frigoritolerans]